MKPIVRSLLLLCATLTLSCLRATRRASAHQADNGKPITVGRWTARWLHGGLYLDYDHVPLTRGGLVQLFAPNYAQGYYGSGSQPPEANVQILPDGGRSYTALFHYAVEGRAFDASQTIEVHPQDRVIYTIRAGWQGADDAILEWNPLRLWAYPLVGATYTAQPAQATAVTGRIGYRPLPGSYPVTSLAPPWNTLTLQNTAVGDITLTGQATVDGPILYDGREDTYLQGEKLFWGGYPALDLKSGQVVTYSLTLTIAPRPAPPSSTTVHGAAPTGAVKAAVRSVPNARVSLLPLTDGDGHPVIIPQPKQATFAGGDYPLCGTLPVTVAGLSGEDGRRVREELARLTAQLRLDTGIRVEQEPGKWRGHGLLVAIAAGQPAAPDLPAAPERAEGYTLRVTSQSVIVIGHDAAGAYYGLQTLRQLLRRDAAGKPVCVGATIIDWPSLPFRGAHVFVGKNALPFHKKLIERIFSRYKLNKVVIECEYTAWKSHPEIHVDYSMPTDDLRADVKFARNHFMEPIPLVNSLGHSGWIFANGQHHDILENPLVPYSYNPNNPDSYKLLFDIYQETLDIFHPRLFHIGHDEVPLPARPENVKKGLTALFIDDTNRLADWLRARKTRSMLWGDMLLHSSEGAPLPGNPVMTAANAPNVTEAQARRAGLPKDALIADWRYEAGSEQRNGLAILKQAGFDTIGCSWYEPENIRGWAATALQNNALGTLQTIWAGYNSNESLLETEYNQFTAYILAAEYAWSGSTLHPDVGNAAQKQGQKTTPPNTQHPTPKTPLLLPYTANNVFARSYQDLRTGTELRKGWLISSGAAANVQLLPDAKDGMPLCAPQQGGASPVDGDLLPAAETGILLPQMPASGIMLRGALASPAVSGTAAPLLPRSVLLRVGRRAHTLAFLHATAYAVANGVRAGTYIIRYADGKRVEIPLRYGYQIRALDDHAPSNSFSTSAIDLQGETPLTLRLLQWRNPRPEVVITTVEFRADDPLAAPILFGLTGIQ